MDRRTFLIGGASGLTLVAVSACTSPEPAPTPTTPSATPTPSALAVPEPAGMARSSWSNDPYSYGSFSYLGLGANPAQRDNLAAPVADRLFFAGEATSSTHPATVVGARATGGRAADEVLAVAQPGERIAVIGAGIAGATAGRRLHDAGFEVVVLEARERTGGRIDTRTSDDWDVSVELGAGLVDSDRAALLLSKLQLLDVATVPLDPSSTIRTEDGVEVEPTNIGADAVADAVDSTANIPGDITIATALDQTMPTAPSSPAPAEGAPTRAEWLESYLRDEIAIAYGADADELSAKYGTDDGSRGGDRIVLGEYESLVDAELDGVSVWTTNVVSTVAYDDEGVSLRFATGESLQVDRVVVTVPLGVLKSGAIRFEPSLPLGHAIAIAGLGMGNLEKVWLRFEEPFWTTDAVRWTVIGGDFDITEWLNLQPATGSPILVGLVGGERAAALAELGDGEVVELARRSLEPFAAD